MRIIVQVFGFQFSVVFGRCEEDEEDDEESAPPAQPAPFGFSVSTTSEVRPIDMDE